MKTKIWIGCLAIVGSGIVGSCKKIDGPLCFDASVVHHNPCPEDCPRVCGCDGKTYCNECIAGWDGISIVHDGPCP